MFMGGGLVSIILILKYVFAVFASSADFFAFLDLILPPTGFLDQ